MLKHTSFHIRFDNVQMYLFSNPKYSTFQS